ncbi:hypothetical protein CCHL11_00310 [Colletotrichum chlorophyti]|uniref:Uncharacterized protein n=1 Tax=Colletotrichum chlorophyti TaxID=708187 RepID=A0A1Q8RUJ3_9PEZI|nr:hypothetical protein CCHL11_00310 [Colletotrichum chlorophyti]
MGGLIPLLLKPAAGGSRNSVVFSANKAALPNTSTPSTTPRTNSNTMTSPAGSPKSRAHKRPISQAPIPLPVLPYTSAEWSKAVSDVKRQYLNRKYRPCSMRCCEILDNIKDSANIEPAYLIYLHFYAASSFEMISRPLQGTSPYKTMLLQQAHSHYSQASELCKAADDNMSRSSRPSSAATSSSMHSPSSSTSSRASSRTWTNSTVFSSPTPSVCSVEDAVAKLANAQSPQRKRVTFSDCAPEEPFIRPDSPTLGFENFLCAPPSPEPARYLPVLPEEPEPADEPEDIVTAPTPEPLNEDCDAFDFLRERSIHRYCSLVSSLRAQIAIHITNVEDELAGRAQGDDAAEALPARAATPELSEELRYLDIKARIVRLKSNNWQRRRFDASRYEALRESVLSELE